jgi:hypothetical protein
MAVKHNASIYNGIIRLNLLNRYELISLFEDGSLPFKLNAILKPEIKKKNKTAAPFRDDI